MGSAAYLEPMKALGVSTPPSGTWRCEIKFDGYRSLTVINGGEIELWSRNHKSLALDYPTVAAAAAKIKCRNAVLDGEICALDERGRSRFQLLQGRDLPGAAGSLVYYVFDLPYLNGVSLVNEPIEKRQALLAKLLPKPPKPIQVSPFFDVEPAELFEVSRQKGLEGIIAKQLGSVYQPGKRSGVWLKCKNIAEQEFVIGGYTQPQKSRQYFGAILVGYQQGSELLYAGKVGTGFDRHLLETLHAKFQQRGAARCPFANLPIAKKPRFGNGMTRAEMNKVAWLKPDLVAQIKFAEWTHDGLLRQPVFLGLRKDKKAKDVVREVAPA
jgi:bifunctional non-homologous end joining protein LigD